MGEKWKRERERERERGGMVGREEKNGGVRIKKGFEREE